VFVPVVLFSTLFYKSRDSSLYDLTERPMFDSRHGRIFLFTHVNHEDSFTPIFIRGFLTI
jgi:hypothetical protein